MRRWLPVLGWLVLAAESAAGGTIPAPVRVVQVAPEVRHKQYRLSAPEAVINVLEVQLGGKVELATVKAGGLVAARAPLTTLLKEAGAIAGVNGDFFFGSGVPIGPHVIDGQVVRSAPRRPLVGMTSAGKPFIDTAVLEARLFARRGTVQINAFNRGRGEDGLIAFNHWFGESTRTNRWGREVTLSLLGPPRVNDTTFALIARVDSAGNRPIPLQGMVLSGHDAAGDWLRQQCAVGDTVRVWVGLKPVCGEVSWVIGGGPCLVRDGKMAAAEIASWGNGGFVTARHPRTAVGFSADSSLVFLVTVDGRQPGYSEGMTLLELAVFLVDLGVQQALNLDGGGSTTMVIHGKVVNRPAEDGQERPIANGIIVRRRASEEQ